MNPDHDELGQTLTRVLQQAAAFAPQGPVVVPVRHRRRGLRVALAAVAVACVLTGIVVAVRTVTPRAYEPAGPGTPVQKARPVEQVWPRAVRPLPAWLPWGTTYRVVLVLDGRTVLAQTPGGLVAVDTTTGASRRLAAPSASGYYFTAADGWIAWLNDEKVLGKPRRVIHTVKVTGGRVYSAAMMGDQKGGDQFGRLAISGGDVIWSSVKGKGVFRASLTGGHPQMIAGTEGYHVLAWPWLTDHPPYLGYDGHRKAGTLRNAVTGEVRRPPAWAMTCSVSWCVRDEEYRTMAAGRNGVREWTMQGPSGEDEIFLDRFVWTVGVDLASVKAGLKPGEHTGVVDRHPTVVDLTTGITATLTPVPDSDMSVPFRVFTVNGRPYLFDPSAV